MKDSEFQALLSQEFPNWSQKLSPTLERRGVKLSITTLQHICRENLGLDFIEKLKEQLPSDAILENLDGEPLKHWQGETGWGSGRYDLYFYSQKWPPIEDEGMQEIDGDLLFYKTQN